MIEIERKFLVTSPPKDYLTWNCFEIKQGYLAITEEDKEVRIRSLNDNYFQTVKWGLGLTRGEIEIEITKDQFNKLWPATEGKRLIKNRYTQKANNHLIELDIYKDKLDGLMIAEVEFKTEEESHDFSPPQWFEREITSDNNFTSKKVAY